MALRNMSDGKMQMYAIGHKFFDRASYLIILICKVCRTDEVGDRDV